MVIQRNIKDKTFRASFGVFALSNLRIPKKDRCQYHLVTIAWLRFFTPFRMTHQKVTYCVGAERLARGEKEIESR
jgi:hypothetical protein